MNQKKALRETECFPYVLLVIFHNLCCFFIFRHKTFGVCFYIPTKGMEKCVQNKRIEPEQCEGESRNYTWYIAGEIRL